MLNLVQDACVSYYHHNLLFKDKQLDCSFPEFARDLYMRSNLPHGGYFEMLQSGWARRESHNLLFVWYEEMKQDQRYWVNKMTEHLGYSLEERLHIWTKSLKISKTFNFFCQNIEQDL